MAIVFETQEDFERAVMEVIMKRVGFQIAREGVWVDGSRGGNHYVIKDLEIFAHDIKGEVE